MSRGLKITLIIIGVLAVLCCLAGTAGSLVAKRVANQTVATDPVKAAQIGHEIVDYTAPPGHKEMAAMSLAGMKWVMLGADSTQQVDSPFTISLMQYPANSNLSQEEMQRQMSQVVENQSQTRIQSMKVVGTQQVTIKGQPVTLTISEGTNNTNGAAMRQMMGMFTDKSRLVLIVITGFQDYWDQSTVDKFLASIR